MIDYRNTSESNKEVGMYKEVMHVLMIVHIEGNRSRLSVIKELNCDGLV